MAIPQPISASESAPTPPASPPADEAMLIGWLRERDAACPLCGYNLRALQTPRCPECGQSLRLSVALSEPYLKAWITLLVFTCFGAGLGMLTVVAAFKGGFAYGPALVRIAYIIFICCTPLPLIVAATRRRFLKLDRSAQWLWTVPPTALVATGFVVMLLSMIFE